MNPKEKAQELIQNFTFKCKECDYKWNAKQCALIAVDEILEAIKAFHYGIEYLQQRDYWFEVKHKLEKL